MQIKISVIFVEISSIQLDMSNIFLDVGKFYVLMRTTPVNISIILVGMLDTSLYISDTLSILDLILNIPIEILCCSIEFKMFVKISTIQIKIFNTLVRMSNSNSKSSSTFKIKNTPDTISFTNYMVKVSLDVIFFVE